MTLDQTDSQTMTELSAKLAQVPLKQKRLLSDDTHAYQHFELPTSPTHTSDNDTRSTSPASLSRPGSATRPSAAFLNAAADPYDSSGSGSGSESTTPPHTSHLSQVSAPAEKLKTKFVLGSGSSDSTPAHSRNASRNPSRDASRDTSPAPSPGKRPQMPARHKSSPNVSTPTHSSIQLSSLKDQSSSPKQKSRFSLAKSFKKATHWDLGHSNSNSSNYNTTSKDTKHREAHHYNPMLTGGSSTSSAVHLGFSSSSVTSSANASPKTSKSHGSMMELKRFFKTGKKDRQNSSSTLSGSRSGFFGGQHHNQQMTRTEFNHNIVGGGLLSRDGSSVSLKNMPFAEDGFKKYGKVGKILGSGAGGSVRLMKRTSDNTTFAIKEFRPRRANESQKEYAKKVTAEFCIGSTLHHANIIETLDIIQDDGKYYEVMEYCPFDFFAIVMSGKMTKGEIGCTFKQIINGVMYINTMGLSHRDLKLDNCVVTREGVVKIIDFGSAAVFRYPFETEVVKAKGVVGSDPYLAPEVFTQQCYDPRPTDVWSIAIIYCCMTLRRFPWKIPKMSDAAFKLFATKPTKEEQDMYYEMGLLTSSQHHSHHHSSHKSHHEKEHGEKKEEEEEKEEGKKDEETKSVDLKDGKHEEKNEDKAEDKKDEQNEEKAEDKKDGDKTPPPKQVIKGPWRLLRLLPHESRHIIGRMLELDPLKRATLEEVWQDPWISKLNMCTVDHGKFIKAGTHSHTCVADEEAHLESYKK